MGEDLKKIKERLPLLDYLQQHNWTARPAAHGSEFVGLCPLHPETRPSFYVNARKNLFYCHGCGQQINDFEATIAQKQQAWLQQFSQVNAILQTLPVTLAQIDNQLGPSTTNVG